ncbi:unnamed protein product [Pleuronectes platessa]|uniref:Uncharacterized protein n=1 Tax=Pleuronectes platessa TaxID=8262 RepID=A0A9N7TU88_PLEPL|nr:unnamed protein product [Pleuronectes platessa]
MERRDSLTSTDQAGGRRTSVQKNMSLPPQAAAGAQRLKEKGHRGSKFAVAMPVMEQCRPLPDPEPCTEGRVGTAAALRVTTSQRGRIRGMKEMGEAKPSGFWEGESCITTTTTASSTLTPTSLLAMKKDEKDRLSRGGGWRQGPYSLCLHRLCPFISLLSETEEEEEQGGTGWPSMKTDVREDNRL